MRKKIVAGNWKMNTTLNEGIFLAQQVRDLLNQYHSIKPEVIVCPPFTHLYAITESLRGSRVRTGSQNCASDESGAFTGEVSASMVSSTGSEYVIIGHSERRSLFSEAGTILNRKVKVAMKYGLKIIFCCGEVLTEREKNIHFKVVKKQLFEGILSLTAVELKSIVIAYEPVWAIGTGITATSSQAQEMHAYIRNVLTETFGEAVADNTSILYGGSCNPGNAGDLFSMKDIDGGLIGGASLNADDFYSIIKSF